MPKAFKTKELPTSDDIVDKGAKSLLPHNHQKSPFLGAFFEKGHTRDTILRALKRMQAPSEPEINRTQPNKWFIEWHHDVPTALWHRYDRKRIRIKKYDNINRRSDNEREAYAETRRQYWKYQLEINNYNPFEKELQYEEWYNSRKVELSDQIELEETKKAKSKLPEETRRKQLPIPDAFEAFMKSRRDRKLEPPSIGAYQGLVDWLEEGFKEIGCIDLPVGELKHINISGALNYIAEEREWTATTINKGVEFAMTLFNWLDTEEYIDKNPSKGKFIKLPTLKTKHRWYDKDTKKQVIDYITAKNNMSLLRACQFTYWLMIRSKKELRMLKVGDIDRTLKRIRFRADLSKNDEEMYRDFTPEFEAILNEMDLHKYPNHFYVFGSGDGTPGIKQCGHNYFSKMFMAVKEKLELSMDYTVYGFKHTRIVHELMKGTDGYQISHMARHNDKKSTKDYMRDYDITLMNIYKPEDLTF